MSGDVIIEVRKLKRYFPIRGGLLQRKIATVQAVDDVSFDVRRGETLGIVGESGCGKSTTARLLIQLLAADAGSIVFEGEAVGTAGGMDMRDLRRQVQMVFQDSYSSLNPRCTIEDTIAYGPSVHGLSWEAARQRAREILGKVGLDPALFAVRYPHELSGGQRQRVNIARALALEPKVVVLDEPVSALDKSVEAQVLNLLVDLKRELALTYIFISHDLNVVQYMSDRVLVMYLGKVVEIGPVESIYGRPQPSLYARAARRHAVHGPRPAWRAGDADGRSAEPHQSAARLPLPHALRPCGGLLRSGGADAGHRRRRQSSRRLPHADTGLRPQLRAPGGGVRRPEHECSTRDPPSRCSGPARR